MNLAAAVCFAVAALSLWSAMNFYGLMSKTGPDPYQVGRQLSRYAEAAAQAPAEGVLGYEPAEQKDVKAQALFYIARYALAPRLVTTAPGQKIVLKDEESGARLEKAGGR
jgi:hypothetical protein